MKAVFTVLSILLGIVFYRAYSYSCLIQYLLMFMLFFTFLGVKVNRFHKNTLWIVVANIVIAFAFYLLVLPFNSGLALICFITAITPTATAAPAITSFLHGDVQYVTFSVILTNSIVALNIPWILPLLVEQNHPISTKSILFSVLFLFLIPLVAAQLVKAINPQLKKSLLKYKIVSFYAWNIVVFLASARATYCIFNEAKTEPKMIVLIAISSLVICIVNFSIGKLIGGKHFAQEASQSLGQKNTMFTVWLSLTFLGPVVALGPMFYIIYHNFYNSYQLLQIENHRKAKVLA
jgi:BASS family bile acid:Na+ symporter